MEYLKIFTDFARSIEPLDDAERGRLFSAMLAYAESGQVPDLPGNERFLWPTARLHIDREAAAVAQKRQSGAQGGKARQAKASTARQSQAPSSSKDKEKEKDKEKKATSSPGGEEDRRPRGPYANVFLTDQELEKLKAEFPDWEQRIQRMGEYLATTGKTYENYLAALRRWARKDREEQAVKTVRPPRSVPPQRDCGWMAQYVKG